MVHFLGILVVTIAIWTPIVSQVVNDTIDPSSGAFSQDAFSEIFGGGSQGSGDSNDSFAGLDEAFESVFGAAAAEGMDNQGSGDSDPFPDSHFPPVVTPTSGEAAEPDCEIFDGVGVIPKPELETTKANCEMKAAYQFLKNTEFLCDSVRKSKTGNRDAKCKDLNDDEYKIIRKKSSEDNPAMVGLFKRKYAEDVKDCSQGFRQQMEVTGLIAGKSAKALAKEKKKCMTKKNKAKNAAKAAKKNGAGR